MGLTAKIRKRYGAFQLETELAAESSGILALLGASGCGKSVTLRCLAGIDRPDEGYIALDGQVLFDSRQGIDLCPQKRRVGYLFQQYALFPNMTVEQNIAAVIPDRKNRREETAQLIRWLRLEGQENKRPHQLSGGQQQRAALGRILASRPAAILLDEPFSALDSCLKQQLELELRDLLARFSGPVVWVSHDRGEVCRNCHSVCVLEGGRSSPVMEMRQFLESPGTVGAARLSGCENLLPVRRGPGPDTVETAWGEVLRCSAPWRPGVTTLGIRACCLRPAEGPGENRLRCRVERVTEDVSRVMVFLRPAGGRSGAALVMMELDREQWVLPEGGGDLWLLFPPERMMLLEEG